MKPEDDKNIFQKGYIKVSTFFIILVIAICLPNLDFFGGVWTNLMNLIQPFMYGLVIAYLSNPICKWIESWLRKWFKKPETKETADWVRGISIVGTLVIVIAVLAFLIQLVVPQAIESITTLASRFPQMLQSVEEEVSKIPFLSNRFESVLDTAFDELGKLDFTSMVGTVGVGVTSTIGSVYDVIMGLIFAIYLLGNKKQLLRQNNMILKAFMPEQWRKVFLEECCLADRLFMDFLVGKVLDSAIIGVISFIVFIIAGFKNSLMLAVIVGVTNIIPFFGPIIGAVPCTLFVLVDEGIMRSVVMVVIILVIQQFDSNILGPKVLGAKTGLSSMWVFAAIILFGDLWGIAGMLVGVPLFAVIYDVVKKVVRYRIDKIEAVEGETK